MINNEITLFYVLAGVIDYIIYMEYQKMYAPAQYNKPEENLNTGGYGRSGYVRIIAGYIYNIMLAIIDIYCVYMFSYNNVYGIYIILFAFMLLNYKNSIFDIYTAIANAAYHISTSIMVNMLVCFILESYSLTRLEKTAGDIYKELICIIMIRILLVVIINVYNKYIGIEFGGLAGIAITVISFVVSILSIMISRIGYEYADVRKNVMVILIIMWCLMNIMAALINMIEQNSRHSYELIMLERERETNSEIYDNIKSGQEELRDMRHDIKNRLSSLRSVIVQNDSRAALDYLDGMIGSVDMVKGKIYCNNLVINNILTYKLSNIHHNISVECEAEVPEQINIDMGDLGVIIGNLLDNSIKAVNNISTGGYIHIIITESIGKLIIIIENNYQNEKEKKPAIYYIDHGRGVNNVRRIVKKYGGSYKENISKNVYQTRISI